MLEPIAIIGLGCYFPGIKSPIELWNKTLQGEDLTMNLPKNYYWPFDLQLFLNAMEIQKDYISYHLKGGYLPEFEKDFDPRGFLLAADEIMHYDKVIKLPLYCIKQAMETADYTLDNFHNVSASIVLGNLSYPSSSMLKYCMSIWLSEQSDTRWRSLIKSPIDYHNRFMSGSPALVLSKALGIQSVDTFCIDSACSSSLYALNIACQKLQSQQVDLAIAGGVNAADHLFVQLGFKALQALSRVGLSRPFHPKADGLIPGQGCGLVILKRLTDAIRDRNKIYAMIRGVGVSNDGGRGGVLLAPSKVGQIEAMRRAYESADLIPQNVFGLECHATGTSLGDQSELSALREVFGDHHPLKLTALKSNIGHTLAASGIAAMLRLILSFQHDEWPGVAHLDEKPIQLLKTAYQISQETQSWKSSIPKIGAVNAFGMGGSNAHLILEEWSYQYEKNLFLPAKKRIDDLSDKIVIIASECMAAKNVQKETLLKYFIRKINFVGANESFKIENIELPIMGLHFPPRDLHHCLGQQLMMLKLANQVFPFVKKIPNKKTAIYFGMQCDPDIARFSFRWFIEALCKEAGLQYTESSMDIVRDSISDACRAEDVLGGMPNVLASRIALQYDCHGPCFSISSEALSGASCLQQAIHDLKNKLIDMAVVGAVSMGANNIDTFSSQALLRDESTRVGDVAALLILKRATDAKSDDENLLAVIDDRPIKPGSVINKIIYDRELNDLVGYTHGVNGLLGVVLSAGICQEKYRHLKRAETFCIKIKVTNPSDKNKELSQFIVSTAKEDEHG